MLDLSRNHVFYITLEKWNLNAETHPHISHLVLTGKRTYKGIQSDVQIGDVAQLFDTFCDKCRDNFKEESPGGDDYVIASCGIING